MTCREVGRHLPGYLDGAISVQHHARVREHLEACDECRNDLYRYDRLARVLADVRPVTPPAGLATQVRLETARLQLRLDLAHPFWGRVRLFVENILEPLAVPATGGLLSAAFVFVFVVQSLIVGLPLGGVKNDLPIDLIQPAQLESLASFPIPSIVASNNYSQAGSVLIDATVNAEGNVGDYTILSGPSNPEIRHQIDQVLIFSRFRPELNFGRPTDGGHVYISFSEVRVRG